MRRLVALGAVLGMIMVGLATVPAAVSATTHARPKGQAIQWGDCSDPNLKAAHAQCALLPVPLDYSNPTGPKIKIAISIVRHTTAQSQGPMLVNPGGPGGSGLVYAILGRFVPNGAGSAYDWIGFDPRGVGSSQPSISCIPDYFGGNRPQYVPTKQGILNTWLKRSSQRPALMMALLRLLSHRSLSVFFNH